MHKESKTQLIIKTINGNLFYKKKNILITCIILSIIERSTNKYIAKECITKLLFFNQKSNKLLKHMTIHTAHAKVNDPICIHYNS